MNKILYLLAHSGHSMKEIEKFLMTCERNPRSILAKISDLRSSIDGISDRPEEVSNKSERNFNYSSFDNLLATIQARTNMSSSEIASSIKQEILRYEPKTSEQIPEFKSKEGLRKWMQRLSNSVSPSLISHALARVARNNYISKERGWSLRDSD